MKTRKSVLLSEAVDNHCRSMGIRHTRVRKLVASYFDNCGKRDAFDAETIYIQLRKDGARVCIAAVYQAITWMCNAGFMEKAESICRKQLFRMSKIRGARSIHKNRLLTAKLPGHSEGL